MTPATYNLPDTVKGDTLNSITFTMLDGVTPINLTGYDIKIMFKKYPTNVASKTIEIGSGITIVNAAAGQFRIDEFNVTLSVGEYFYDIQFTDPSDEIKTYIAGTFNVLQDVTT